MPATLMVALRTLREHLGPATWAFAVFACGFVLAFPVVRYNVRSLLAFPRWLLRLARKYLRPELSPVLLCSFIFLFNTGAIFLYMMSGGLIFLPIVFDLFTGLNVAAVMLKDAEDAEDPRKPEPAPDDPRKPRAWVGFLSLFVIVVELGSFWLAIGMGMKLGHVMRDHFAWETFVRAAEPRALAYVVVLVPALFLSAMAETAAIKAMLAGEQT